MHAGPASNAARGARSATDRPSYSAGSCQSSTGQSRSQGRRVSACARRRPPRMSRIPASRRQDRAGCGIPDGAAGTSGRRDTLRARHRGLRCQLLAALELCRRDHRVYVARCSRAAASDPASFVARAISVALILSAPTVSAIARRGLAHQIRRPIHRAKVHTSEVLADNSKPSKLRTGEDRDNRGQECETWHGTAIDQEGGTDLGENRDAEQHHGEPDQAGDL